MKLLYVDGTAVYTTGYNAGFNSGNVSITVLRNYTNIKSKHGGSVVYTLDRDYKAIIVASSTYTNDYSISASGSVTTLTNLFEGSGGCHSRLIAWAVTDCKKGDTIAIPRQWEYSQLVSIIGIY